ncbi:MAG TPA: DUF3455 domain-containing protein [Candidatus Limnocylindria bacterium]|jgi:hypothetical protein|nr:DUF3455 domain-containing protein [Candidatus Limnocylindria bacterium]
MNRLIQGAAVIGMLLAAQGQGPARPEVPESLKTPAGEELILLAHATGVQIYVCQAGADPKFGWVFKAPEAELTDSAGKKVVHHSAGPTWRHVDGSEVKGKVIAKQDAPKPDAIPWLLLGATGHSGEGVFSRVTSIPANPYRGWPATECKYVRCVRERQSVEDCILGRLLFLRA